MPAVGNAVTGSSNELIHVHVCCLTGKRTVVLTENPSKSDSNDYDEENKAGSTNDAAATDKELDSDRFRPQDNGNGSTSTSATEPFNGPVVICRCLCCLFYKMGGFPEVIVRYMLTKITDQQTILNCRLISPIWNGIIENSREEMKKITFPISDIKGFLDLPIAKKGKVKSISLKNTSLRNSEYLDNFMDLIGSTIEKVAFAFLVEDSYKQPELFKLIIGKCTNLEEVIVKVNKLCMGPEEPVVEVPLAVFDGFTSEDNIASRDKIKHVSVETNYLTAEAAEGLAQFLLQLPKLKTIKLNGRYTYSALRIYTGIVEHIKKYEDQLHLKELSFCTKPYPVLHRHLPEFFWLVTLGTQHKIRFTERPIISFNAMLRLSDTPETPLSLLEQRPLFPIKVSGCLCFFPSHSSLINLDRFHSLNVRHLTLQFRREVLEGELSWIKHIQGLRVLTLRVHPSYIARLGLPSVVEFQEAFSAGLPTLRVLQIRTDIFESIHFIRWAQYFPNLVKLHIEDWKITPENLISGLSVLESLSMLHLKNLPLNDISFTASCMNRLPSRSSSNGYGNHSNSELALAPAIACIKLKILELHSCPLLTNNCVINGISQCKNLEKLMINSCRNMTEDCKRFVTCEVEFLKYESI